MWNERVDDFRFFNTSITQSNLWVRVIVLNATFNNISVISYRPVLLVEETGIPEQITYLPRGIRTHNVNGDRYWLQK